MTVAWKRGSFPGFMDGADKEEFLDQMVDRIAGSGAAYVLEAASPKGHIPVGLMLMASHGHRVEPHVSWFSWAMPRQKMESVVHLVNELRRQFLVVVPAKKEDWPFYTHVCKHGIMKRVGKAEDWFGFEAGNDSMIFISRRPSAGAV